MKPFGENLKELMAQRRVSVREVAKAVNVPLKTVQEWTGSGARTPRNLSAIRDLASFFECSIHFLLYGEEDPKDSLAVLLNKTEIHTGLYEISIKKVSTKKKE
jgi:transcriptional regulator with XRE-family HTH domain